MENSHLFFGSIKITTRILPNQLSRMCPCTNADLRLSSKYCQVPECAKCGGILKPDVVFFGDNVPRPKVNQVFDYVDKCDKILVAGSSLYVSVFCARLFCMSERFCWGQRNVFVKETVRIPGVLGVPLHSAWG